MAVQLAPMLSGAAIIAFSLALACGHRCWDWTATLATAHERLRVREMLIRPLQNDDADTLWAARLQALRESPAAFLSTLAEAVGDTAQVMRTQLDDPHTRYFGAFDQATLVGFLRYVRPVRLARRHTAEIHSVHVGAGHRGQGIARQLFLAAFAAAHADGIESLTLTVLADNAAARALYVSLGFIESGIEPRAVKRDGRYVDTVSYWISVISHPPSPEP
ncbi:GNAT family N-acetyltransferase [Stenotrophomonas sp. Sm6012]|uniref:GNAT family N-acetyltransferase n=1 Tax=Stenotrophomonas sp. Sm6012 TaxID=3002745 RepID=UPI0013105C8B|nr:GNAT family N-acetyltransferase [Stenotrophomonas sp. Sm6012]MDQ7279587.1 GNAT family N-acetyltransferase [Stenotrophomonas sp. Sm6012]